jgi:alkanesulfonate monooxygenase SsuD/methylene tetrahydromethanopterin reductase-like flavin-dependent oxidoreductase (luciferase family)
MALPVLLGANVDPVWQDPHYPLRLAQQVDASGLDHITIQDHPYQSAFYDAWTLLTFLAARTEHVTLVPTVANLPLRPPAVLAKATASLALLSGGRVQLGLGAGAFWDAIAAFGGPRRDGKEAVDALDEAIDVIRALWSGDRSVRAGGTHYQVKGAHPGPPAAAGLGIWLGAYGPRMLALTGSKADGWIPSLGFLGLDKLSEAVARVDDAASAAGRDPAAIRKVYNVGGMIGRESPEPFQGSVQQWVDQLVAIVREHGMNGFTFWPNDDRELQLAIFAAEVAPAVRAALATST